MGSGHLLEQAVEDSALLQSRSEPVRTPLSSVSQDDAAPVDGCWVAQRDQLLLLQLQEKQVLLLLQ